MNLVEGEDRRLAVPALFLFRINVKDAQFLEGFAENDFCGDIGQGIPGRLGEERHSAGRARIDFNDEHILVLINNELNVVQTHNADAQTKSLCILKDLTLHFIGDGESGIHADGVAGVDTGAFHQFHDAGHEHIVSVADRIDFHFLALDVLVHQNRLVDVDFNGGLQIVAELVFIAHDLHGAAAEHEARAHQDRIADLFRCADTFLNAGHRAAHRLGNLQFFEHFLKTVTVFSAVNRVAVRTDELDTALHERRCQIDCSLAAKACDDAVRLFKINDVHDTLGRQGLEVQLV